MSSAETLTFIYKNDSMAIVQAGFNNAVLIHTQTKYKIHIYCGLRYKPNAIKLLNIY